VHVRYESTLEKCFPHIDDIQRIGSFHIFLRIERVEMSADSADNMFLINTEGCTIPNLNPYDPLIKTHLNNGEVLKCAVQEDRVYSANGTIFINWEVVKISLPTLTYCKYDVIWRPPYEAKNHNFYTFVNESAQFVSNISVTDEFIRVRCFNEHNTAIYTNVFSFVPTKTNVEERCAEGVKKYSKNKTKIEELSILILGVDSVSRSNMIRYMPETRKYLLQNMSAFELNGYNKVADNTFINIVPMTTGKFVKELPWTQDIKNVTFDKYDFIWKKYSQHGYRTLYCEDAPGIQIFDYLKAGFSKFPADYFNRPFSRAAEDISDLWNSGHQCIHARPETGIMLDYLKQFLYKFKSLIYFAFTFLTRLTHDYLAATRKADAIYLKIFEDISRDATLNKTVLFFLSDHGIRFGAIRQTSVGKLEERLPFMFRIFHDWFLKKYPNIHWNLQVNSKRLTTPSDIHRTLLNLFDFEPDTLTSMNPIERGLNLLNEVPTSRTCEDAGILPHWCTCSQQKVLSNTNESVIDISKQFVGKINEKLTNLSQCENLSLSEVKYASRLVTSDKVLSFKRKLSDVNNLLVEYGKRVNTYVDYQLTIQTRPGGALFEGTLRFDEETNHVQMMGDISRINRYGTQSHCIDTTNVKKFCYCKKQR
jgi:CheY-specific phosphatase CheX